MRQSLRSALRKTRVVTAAGYRLGWLADAEVDLATGRIQKFRVVSSRWCPWSTIGWVDRGQVCAWEAGRLVVQDGALSLVKRALPADAPLSASVPSLYAERRR